MKSVYGKKNLLDFLDTISICQIVTRSLLMESNKISHLSSVTHVSNQQSICTVRPESSVKLYASVGMKLIICSQSGG